MGKQSHVFLCVFQFQRACRIELADGTVIDRTTRRTSTAGRCTEGPLTGYQYNGKDAEAYFPEKRSRSQRQRRAQFGDGEVEAEQILDEIESP